MLLLGRGQVKGQLVLVGPYAAPGQGQVLNNFLVALRLLCGSVAVQVLSNSHVALMLLCLFVAGSGTEQLSVALMLLSWLVCRSVGGQVHKCYRGAQVLS